MYHLIRGEMACPWCDKAKALLESSDVNWSTETLDMGDLILRQAELGHPTVPVILKNGVLLGGYTELATDILD